MDFNTCRLAGCLVFWIGWLLSPATAIAGDADLQARVGRLEKQVIDLQAENQLLRTRINQLESPEPATPAQVAPANEGWRDRANWRKLRQEMNEADVEALLGPPQKVKATGVLTCWFYLPSETLGPHVIFSGRSMKVYGWEETQATDTTP
jgi:hypothetical protein